MLRRLALPVAVVLLSLALPASASATFHLVKVSEVYPGTPGDPESAFVELQAHQAGQNQIMGHQVVFKDMNGSDIASFGFGSNAPNAQSQRTFLMGASNVSGADQVANIAGAINPAGGAVCFDNIDCAAWGNITPAGVASLPSAAGAPAAPAGIPNGSSLTRSKARSCATLLEDADDTNDSAMDFASATPSPRGNSVAPTETACVDPPGPGGGAPETVIDRGPKKKSASSKATFLFSSPNAAAAGFECRLDRQPFKTCSSPQVYRRLKAGKHAVSVRAVVAGTPDPSPAKYTWKIKKKPKKK